MPGARKPIARRLARRGRARPALVRVPDEHVPARRAVDLVGAHRHAERHGAALRDGGRGACCTRRWPPRDGGRRDRRRAVRRRADGVARPRRRRATARSASSWSSPRASPTASRSTSPGRCSSATARCRWSGGRCCVALILTAPLGLPRALHGHWTPRAVLSLLALGALGTCVANVMTTIAAGRLGATSASVSAYFIPVVALLLGVARPQRARRDALAGRRRHQPRRGVGRALGVDAGGARCRASAARRHRPPRSNIAGLGASRLDPLPIDAHVDAVVDAVRRAPRRGGRRAARARARRRGCRRRSPRTGRCSCCSRGASRRGRSRGASPRSAAGRSARRSAGTSASSAASRRRRACCWPPKASSPRGWSTIRCCRGVRTIVLDEFHERASTPTSGSRWRGRRGRRATICASS